MNKTIDVILDRVYNKKQISTTLKKRTLKKLILDTCSKTAFMFGGTIYEQKDGVSMGASLGPVLANIIMTELEKVVVDRLMQSGRIKFYARYVDDTLLLVKPEDVDGILQEFNRFHQNLEFTVDTFEECLPHFLDLEIHRDGLSIFRKDTHTAQFVHYDSYTKWNHKVAWIRSLTNRAKNLCSPSKLSNELSNIRRFAAFNGFPKWIARSVMRQSLGNRRNTEAEPEEDEETLYMSLPYNGKEAESIVKRCKKRLIRLFKREKKVKFSFRFQTTKVSFYTSNKDKIPLLSNSGVIYNYKCPGCDSSYIGKTENTLFNRTKEHAWCQKDSAIFKHFNSCEHWKYIVGLFETGGQEIDSMQFQINSVRENTEILYRSDNWLHLSFLESLAIKERKPELNRGLKSCKDLSLF